jgi:hypothetical protein
MTDKDRGDQLKAFWLGQYPSSERPYTFTSTFSPSPTFPFLLRGDPVYFWVYAQRMLSGEQVFQDFFQCKPPGTDRFYLALFKLFGPRIWVTNVAVLVLGVALCWPCFSITKRLMTLAFALLAASLFLVFVYCRPWNATHHWFSLAGTLCAVRIVMPARTALPIAAAGVMLGVASFCTQTAGVAGLLAVLLSFGEEWLSSKKPWKRFFSHGALRAATFGLTLAALNAPIIAKSAGANSGISLSSTRST